MPTIKQIATLQEPIGNRLQLGLELGSMDSEFRTLGLETNARGQVSDKTLAFFNDCFATDIPKINGHPFIFNPRPSKLPILIGGRAV